MLLKDIVDFLEQKAPAATAEEWDNPGLLVESGEKAVTGAVVALDATPAAIHFAIENGANLLVTHHPVIFGGLTRLQHHHPAVLAMQAGVSVFCAHTNLDKAAGGVNDALAALCGLTDVTVAADGMSRVGTLPAPLSSEAFAAEVARVLQAPVAFTAGKTVSRVAVCGGAAGEGVFTFADMVDAYVTGEIKHHEFLAAKAANLTAIAAGHYATEVPVLKPLADWLRTAFPALPVYPFADAAPYTVLKV